MNGFNDLGVVDALQVDGGDAEVAVAELALDDDQRDTLARHLDGVGVAELVGRLVDEPEYPPTDEANEYGIAVPLSDKSSSGTRSP
jgi:hypothetical protein